MNIQIHLQIGSLAQLNRASDYGSEGYRFESYASHLRILISSSVFGSNEIRIFSISTGRIIIIHIFAVNTKNILFKIKGKHFSRMSGSRAIPCSAAHGSLRIRLDSRSRCLAPPISSYIRSWHWWSLISGVCPDFYMPSMRQAGDHSSGAWERRSAGFCIDLLWNTYALWDLDNLWRKRILPIIPSFRDVRPRYQLVGSH